MRHALIPGSLLCIILGGVIQLHAAVAFDFVSDTSLIVLPVTINGHGPYRFILDTGATHTVLSASVADRLQISCARRGTLATPGGSVDVAVCTLKSLNVDTAALMDVEITVANFALMKTLKVDGVLGSDLLRRFKVDIDYDGKIVKIAPQG